MKNRGVFLLLMVQFLFFAFWGYSSLLQIRRDYTFDQRTPCPRGQHQTGTAAVGAGNPLMIRAAESRGVKKHSPSETIIITMASYGDSECAPTIQRAFARAAYPDRIFFAVFQQHNCTDGNEDWCHDCVSSIHDNIKCPEHPLCTRLWQVRVNRMHMMETRGVTYARYMSEKLYKGESFVMAIDAHSQFAKGWDSEIIDMFYRTGDDRAIITTYPAHYGEQHMGHGKHADFENFPSSMMCICQTRRQKVHSTYSYKHVSGQMRRQNKPVRVAFLAAGFNFARGHRVKNVPYDPYTPFLFDGEETSLGLRAWTHGYDFYQPDRNVVAHLYISSGSKLRPVFWTHDWGNRFQKQMGSMYRVNKIMGLDQFNPGTAPASANLAELEKYGLGTVRSAKQYWEFAKMDKTLNPNGPELSESLCHDYENGGMPLVHRNGLDKE